MTKPHLAVVAPATVYGTVDKAGPPKRRLNAEVRSREYLTDLRRTQAMAVGDQDHGGVAVAIAVLASCRNQPIDLGRWRRCGGTPSTSTMAACMSAE